jgi:predicted metal-dependent enzyme (double-stranded beta helix superfamily)
MFDLERFIADCRDIQSQGDNQPAIRELLARAVSEPAAVLKSLGAPTRATVAKLYEGKELTVLNVIWGPQMTIMPHDHRMWALIGVYTGREDNVFWRRLPEDADGRVEAAGAKSLCVKDCAPLGRDIIHSVTNPIPRLTGAIHVYGGDFFNVPRSEWDPESLHEGVYDAQKLFRLFEESNTRMPAAS